MCEAVGQFKKIGSFVGKLQLNSAETEMYKFCRNGQIPLFGSEFHSLRETVVLNYVFQLLK